MPEAVEPGPDAVAFVQARPLADRDSLTVYRRFPRKHWARVRHSNFIERTFRETRRRVEVIGRLPGEHSCLSLVWGRARLGLPRPGEGSP